MDDSSSRFAEDELDEASTPAAAAAELFFALEEVLFTTFEGLFTGVSEFGGGGGKNGTDGDEVSKGEEQERMNGRANEDYFRSRRAMMMKPFSSLFTLLFRLSLRKGDAGGRSIKVVEHTSESSSLC